jgi:hypothetical protein
LLRNNQFHLSNTLDAQGLPCELSTEARASYYEHFYLSSDRYNNPLHLDNPLYAANSNNMAVVSNNTAMPPDHQLPSSIIPMLAHSFDGRFDDSNNPLAGLQGYGAVQAGAGNSFQLSPISFISNYSATPNDLNDAKATHVLTTGA